MATTTTTRCDDDDGARRARDARGKLLDARARRDAAREAVREALTRPSATTRSNAATTTALEEGRRRRVGDARREIDALREVLKIERAALEAARTRIEAMEATEAEAYATLRDAERAALEVEVPCAMAEVEHEFRAVSAARALETRRAMVRLRALLPVRIDEERGSREAPRGVRACEWRVPDAIDDRGFDAHELAAGLGALMHFSALASRYLDAPRLHRGSHAASQSYVWAPTSAWDDVDSSVWENKGTVHVRDFAGVNSERLELFLPRAVVEGSCDPASVRESRLRLKRAIRLLTRSVSVMCAHQSRECGVIAPPNWGPFSQLCALTSAVAKGEETTTTAPQRAPARRQTPPQILRTSTNDRRRESVESFESRDMVQPVTDGAHRGDVVKRAVSSTIAEISRNHWLSAHASTPRESNAIVDDDELLFETLNAGDFFIDHDSVDDIGGWEAIHGNRLRPAAVEDAVAPVSNRGLVLPPPPSAVDDIEHWERAMLVDNAGG
jgi:hypothetical protein